MSGPWQYWRRLDSAMPDHKVDSVILNNEHLART
jgi:hypothetical protein